MDTLLVDFKPYSMMAAFGVYYFWNHGRKFSVRRFLYSDPEKM